MSRIELRKAITQQVTVDKEVRPTLWARRCDSCNRVFMMAREEHGNAEGVFDKTDPHVHGNMFSAHACCFECVANIKNGGWRDMPAYAAFVNADARLIRLTSTISDRIDESELIRIWESKP